MFSYAVKVLIDVSGDDTVGSATVSTDFGTLRGIVATAPNTVGTTFTLGITDKNGGTVFSRASIPENDTTSIWSDKYGGASEYSPLNNPMLGPIIITVTSSGTEVADQTYTVYLYYE